MDVARLDREAVGLWMDPSHCREFIKGRVALYAILRGYGIGRGDEVIIPGFTCVVVPAAVRYTGAQPVFHDIDPTTLQGCPQAAARAMSPQTRAVIVQHNFGMLADLGELPEICRDRGIPLIEDCAHAMGASLGGRPAGHFGDAAFASLQWSKPTTTGLGGLALMNDQSLVDRVDDLVRREFREPTVLRIVYLELLSAMYRKWFRPSLYWRAQGLYRWAGRRGLVQGSSSEEELQSGRMPDGYREVLGSRRKSSLHAAMEYLEATLPHRRRIWGFYHELLKESGFWQPPLPASGELPVALRYPLLVENRDELLQEARNARVEIGDWFNAPLHPRGIDPERFGYRAGSARIAEAAASLIINLPTHTRVTLSDAKEIVDFVLTRGQITRADTWLGRTDRQSRKRLRRPKDDQVHVEPS